MRAKDMATAKDKGWAMDKASYAPVPGDAFVMLHQDGTGHIRFVLRVDKARNATAFNTVEGNCGNRVKVGRRQMDQSTLVGFINQYSREKNRQAGRSAWSRPTTSEPKGRAEKSCAV